MKNTIKIPSEINNQEITFEIIIKGTNNYIVKAEGFVDHIIAKGFSRERQAILFIKQHEIAGVMVGGIGVTDDQTVEIEKIEKEFKQKAIDNDEKIAEDFKNGVTKIKVSYRKGRDLSGYLIFGHEASLLKELGVAKEVGGWRTKVDEELIEVLGEEFTYQEAVEYAKPKLEYNEQKGKQQDKKTKEKLNEATRTGKKVVIRKWQEECNSPSENCDLDNMTEYALPDGTIKIERHHTKMKMG